MKMRLKLLFSFSALFALILISSVYASTCNPDQRIMKLYQASNSHGALWNDTAYNEDICFNEIFGHPYAPYAGAQLHSCAGNNRLINLYQVTNSHGEISGGGNNYANGVCFGDLICRSISSGSCNSADGERAVMSLYQVTNSHISKGDNPSYPVKICCKEGFKIDQLFWANMEEAAINRAELRDRLKLMVYGMRFDGKTIEYSIKKREGGMWLDWLFPDSTVATQTSNKGFTTWKANASGEYYFIARVDGIEYDSRNTPAGNIYGIVTIFDPEANSPPVAKIINPKTGDIFIAGRTINFNQTSYDLDDFLNYSWNFGDGVITKGWTFDFADYNTTHSYALLGQRNINLSVIDGRGLKDNDLVSIFIIDPSTNGKYVFANISKPGWKERVGADVELDASGSFAIEIDDGNIKCLGGDCPLSIPDGTGTIPIDENGMGGDYSPLTFVWKFDDGTSVTRARNKLYNRAFNNGWHWANLTVSIASGEKASTITAFLVSSVGPGNIGCELPEKRFWVEGTTRYSTLLTNDKCKGSDGTSGTLDDCCPGGGYSCRENTTDTAVPKRYQCQLDSTIIQYCDGKTSCSDYTSSDLCTADQCGLGAGDCGGETERDICDTESFGLRAESGCRCEWNSFTGRCEQTSGLNLDISGISLNGTCNIDVTNTGECEEGEMIISQRSSILWDNLNELYNPPSTINGELLDTEAKALQWVSDHCELDNQCFDGTRQVICEEDTIKLNFFSGQNFFSVIIIIIFIYVISFSVRKNKK